MGVTLSWLFIYLLLYFSEKLLCFLVKKKDIVPITVFIYSAKLVVFVSSFNGEQRLYEQL